MSHASNKVVKSIVGPLSSITIIDSSGFSVNYHYDKRLNDFGRRVECVKATIVADDKSQIFV